MQDGAIPKGGKMMGKTYNRNQRRGRSILILGVLSLLCVGYIISFLTGGQSPVGPKAWIAFGASIFFLGFLAFTLIVTVYDTLAIRIRGALERARFDRTHIPSDSFFEINLDGFDSRYEELQRQIDRLPDTRRENDKDKQELRGIAFSLKWVKDRLTQMSGTHPYKDDLEEVRKQLADSSRVLSLRRIDLVVEPLWRRLGGNAEYRKDLIKAKQEAHDLEEMLRKSLLNAEKRKSEF